MRVRRATAADHEAVGEATLAAYAPFTEGEPHAAYRARLRDAAARDREAELWVAVDQGADGVETVLGSVTLCPEGSPWREVAQPGEGEFRMLAVSPAAQGHGVGAALVEHALSSFAERGCTAVVLCSLTQMRAAHRLYERLGFTRVPERDWQPGPGIDLVAFRRALAGTLSA